MSSAAYKAPCDLFHVDGDVLLWGPAGIAFTMTPDAAEETARRLLEAARNARLASVEAFASELQPRAGRAETEIKSRKAA